MSGAAAALALIGLSLWSGPITAGPPLDPKRASTDAAIESFIREAGFPEDAARAMTRRTRAGSTPAAMEQRRAAFETIEGGH